MHWLRSHVFICWLVATDGVHEWWLLSFFKLITYTNEPALLPSAGIYIYYWKSQWKPLNAKLCSFLQLSFCNQPHFEYKDDKFCWSLPPITVISHWVSHQSVPPDWKWRATTTNRPIHLQFSISFISHQGPKRQNKYCNDDYINDLRFN